MAWAYCASNASQLPWQGSAPRARPGSRTRQPTISTGRGWRARWPAIALASTPHPTMPTRNGVFIVDSPRWMAAGATPWPIRKISIR
ncbi:Uncharacterised protein [Bordetella pertussis]|nr:Uncharacterised protein [Bordetella pertussis]